MEREFFNMHRVLGIAFGDCVQKGFVDIAVGELYSVFLLNYFPWTLTNILNGLPFPSDGKRPMFPLYPPTAHPAFSQKWSCLLVNSTVPSTPLKLLYLLRGKKETLITSCRVTGGFVAFSSSFNMRHSSFSKGSLSSRSSWLSIPQSRTS